MRVNIMPCTRGQIGGWPSELNAGVKAHGDVPYFSDKPDDADVHAFWGLKRRHGKSALGRGKRSIVVERAYLGDRFRWRAMGFQGLNGYADFCNQDVPDDRWRKYWRDDVRDWNEGGNYALIIGQVPGDAALYGLDVYKWANKVAEEAWNYYPDVRFRPHPEARREWVVSHADTMHGSLEDALDGAAVVITYTSNVAVDAVMRGVPTITMDRGSMAWEVSSHSLKAKLYKGDRDDWGRKIAYAQWMPEEIRSGEAWAHFRRFV